MMDDAGRAPLAFCVLSLASLVLLLSACESGAKDSAKEEFAKQFTCPAERVETRIREDVKASTLSAVTSKEAPAEVRADPARLAMWQKEKADRAARDDKALKVVEGRGCGHAQLYSCAYASQHASTSSPWGCTPHDYPSGVAKW